MTVYRERKKKSMKLKVACGLVCVIVVVFLASLIYMDRRKEEKNAVYYEQLNEKIREEEQAERQEWEKEESTDSQKENENSDDN